mgnify:CR=1 FL=1
MKGGELIELLEEAERLFEQEGSLIQLREGRAVFVGDTHGDLEATSIVLQRYLDAESTIVFLGDYVDRGPASEENLLTLLRAKLDHPDRVFLLMGNHEGRKAVAFHPADFWERLDPEAEARYAEALSKLPLAASAPNGILALHGAPPRVRTLEEIAHIRLGSPEWEQITWGDREDHRGQALQRGWLSGRPCFGRDWFEETMASLGKNVLVRSHQPDAPRVMFGGRCLTIFTSSAYGARASERVVAVARLDREVRTVDDLSLESI